MKKILLGFVAGLAIGWLGATYCQEPQVKVVEKRVYTSVLVVEEKIVLIKDRAVEPQEAAPYPPEGYLDEEDLKGFGRQLFESIKKEDCIDVNRFQQAVERLGEVYRAQGLEAMIDLNKEFLTSKKRQGIHRLCGMGYMANYTFEMAVLKHLTLEDFWRYKIDKEHEGDYPGIVEYDKGIDIRDFLNVCDREKRIEYLNMLCEDSKNQFIDSDQLKASNYTATSYDNHRFTYLCRSLAKSFSEDFDKAVSWIEDIDEMKIPYQYRQAIKMATEAGYYDNLERDTLPSEDVLIEGLSDAVCDGRIEMISEEYGIIHTSSRIDKNITLVTDLLGMFTEDRGQYDTFIMDLVEEMINKKCGE